MVIIMVVVLMGMRTMVVYVKVVKIGTRKCCFAVVAAAVVSRIAVMLLLLLSSITL